MRIPFFLLVLIFCCLTACQEQVDNTSTITIEATNSAPSSTIEKAKSITNTEENPVRKSTPYVIKPEDLLGYYVGLFKAAVYDKKKDYTYFNKITISIDSLNDKGQVYGHSVVAGNKRPFSGTYQKSEEGVYDFQVKEPGDDKYDGIFEFKHHPKKYSIYGTWKAYNDKLAVSSRNFNLKSTIVEYNPSVNFRGINFAELRNSHQDTDNEGELVTNAIHRFNASVDLLKKEDIENMYGGDLEVIRNAIYARHGYSFKNRKMRFFFDTYVDWYVPSSTDIRKELTALELKNIDLLKRYEQHAERYYDSFGR